MFKNFAGREDQYNRAGDRNFAAVLPEDLASAMLADGWNVKRFKEREEGVEPDFYIEVAVSYKNKPPRVTTISSAGRMQLDESQIDILDYADMANVDLIINSYNWQVGEKSGIKAYLKTMFVTLNEDELERKYAQMED